MSEQITAFCKFRIAKPLGIVSIDSPEPEIKSYIQKLIREFESGNAVFLSWSEFHGNDSDNDSSSGDPQPVDDATFAEVMINVEKNDLHDNNNRLAEKAVEVLRGQSLQVVHSSRHGNHFHIGFTQL